LTTTLALSFWFSLACLCYSYVGYPALIFLVAKLFPNEDHDREPQGSRNSAGFHQSTGQGDFPSVTVLVVAYNAEQHIRERIANILDCDYPAARLQVLVASDGSTDATVSLVQSLGNPRVRALAYPQRRGKTQTLIDAVRHIESDVVLFTDATNRFERDAIPELLRQFRNPHIGIATGKVSLISEQGEPVESAYWKSEMMLRRSEMSLGIMLGANGPIYAMRRNLFVAPKRPVINDDLVLPMLAHLRHKCGIAYDEQAVAYMLSSGGLTSEFKRRCRIGAGAFQSLSVLGELFRWRHAKQAIAFASHKLLRWIGPFFMVAMLLTSFLLRELPIYRLFLGLQAVAYLAAVVGLLLPKRGHVSRMVRVGSSFLVMNLALMTGFFRWAVRPRNVLWSPTVRPVLKRIPAVPQESR
jgi:cellulose synthase/poly-beta-1,6-N-acetylglucosamine synthase-like glycosyltransferase